MEGFLRISQLPFTCAQETKILGPDLNTLWLLTAHSSTSTSRRQTTNKKDIFLETCVSRQIILGET